MNSVRQYVLGILIGLFIAVPIQAETVNSDYLNQFQINSLNNQFHYQSLVKGKAVALLAGVATGAGGVALGTTKAVAKIAKGIKKVNTKKIDTWSRKPKSIQDRLTLEAAKKGEGKLLEDLKLNDPRYKGMEKWEYKIKSKDGKDSVVHYVKDPKTGKLMDFKFTKHSTGEVPK